MKKHYLGKKKFVKLQRWANSIRGYYGVPVYLVGSALQKKDYRDVDVRIILSDYEFGCRYGESINPLVGTQQWIDEGRSGDWTSVRWKWSDDCLKRTRSGWRETGLNIDCQVYPASYAEVYRNRPRIQLDTRIVEKKNSHKEGVAQNGNK